MIYVLGFGTLLGLMALRVPIGLCLGAAGAVGLVALAGFDTTNSAIAATLYSSFSDFNLTMIPMYIVMGLFVSHAGLLPGIFDLFNRLLRRVPGGLAMSTIVACTAFGGISGSSSADAATIGRLSIGEMSKRGYSQPFAAAVVASAATIANLIPPSIVLILYGILTHESIGALLIAGIIPGLLCALALIILIGIITWSSWRSHGREVPSSGRRRRRVVREPRFVWQGRDGQGGEPGELQVLNVREVLFSVTTIFTLFAVIIGGIYSGIFTAAEAGAVASLVAWVALVVNLVTQKGGNRVVAVARASYGAVRETTSLTSMIFLLVGGSALFTQFLVVARLPDQLSKWILGLQVAPVLVVILLFALLIVLGMILDGLSVLLIITPIAYPVITSLGFSGIWFGIVMVMAVEVGLLTPPVGLNVYVVAGLFPGLRAESIFREIFPFVIAQLGALAIMISFPGTVTWLPGLMQ